MNVIKYNARKQAKYRKVRGRVCVFGALAYASGNTVEYLIFREDIGESRIYVMTCPSKMEAFKYAQEYAVENNLAFNRRKDFESFV